MEMASESKWERPETAPVPTVWARFESRKPMVNGKKPIFRIQDYTDEWKEDVVRNMTNFFLKDEPLCKSLKFSDDRAAVEAFSAVFMEFLGRKMGLIAVVENYEELGDQSLPLLAGCNITAVVTNNEKKKTSHLDKVQKIFDIMEVLEDAGNCFEHYKVSELLYAFGLSVDPAYRGHGLGLEILKARFPLCKAVGIKVTATVFTAIAAQKSAEKAGFELLVELPYNEFKDEKGEVVFKIDVPKSIKLMAKKIF